MPKSAEAIRQRIEGVRLTDMLQKYALGELVNSDGEPIELTPGRLHAIGTLLRKVSPDMKSLDIAVETKGNMVVKIINFDAAPGLIDVTPAVEALEAPLDLEEILSDDTE